MKRVFPILVGEVAMSQLTSGSSCECGGKRKKEYCKEKTNSEQVILYIISWTDSSILHVCIAVAAPYYLFLKVLHMVPVTQQSTI